MTIEDDSIRESQKVPETTARAARGRKPAYESRAQDIRARLLVWKRSPEAERPSLRTLADELGTSHQMLGYFLKRPSAGSGKYPRTPKNTKGAQ